MPNKTLLIIRIKPESMETENTLQELKTIKKGELKDAKEETIGFGIKIIKAAFLVKEKEEQAIEALLKEINSLKTVDEAEVEGMTLL